MESVPQEPNRVAAAATGDSEESRRWPYVYAGVLAHLVLWIGLLWWFSRSFGSTQ